MTNKDRKEIGKEVLENMDVTKEQYIEICRLCEDLDLSISHPDPEDIPWDKIIEQASKK